VFGMLSKCSDCLHLACHSHSCSKSLERVGRVDPASHSNKSSQITTTAHLQKMILDDEEGDQGCLACYLSALTVYTLPVIYTRVVSRWRVYDPASLSSKSSQITTTVHLHKMILDDEEGDQVCLACYLSALTVYTLPAIYTRVVRRWRESVDPASRSSKSS